MSPGDSGGGRAATADTKPTQPRRPRERLWSLPPSPMRLQHRLPSPWPLLQQGHALGSRQNGFGRAPGGCGQPGSSPGSPSIPLILPARCTAGKSHPGMHPQHGPKRAPWHRGIPWLVALPTRAVHPLSISCSELSLWPPAAQHGATPSPGPGNGGDSHTRHWLWERRETSSSIT